MFAKVCVVFVMLAYVGSSLAQVGAPGASVGSFPIHPRVLPPVDYRHLDLHEPLIVDPYHHARFNPYELDARYLSPYPWNHHYHI